jgi:hypothetical protein
MREGTRDPRASQRGRCTMLEHHQWLVVTTLTIMHTGPRIGALLAKVTECTIICKNMPLLSTSVGPLRERKIEESPIDVGIG